MLYVSWGVFFTFRKIYLSYRNIHKGKCPEKKDITRILGEHGNFNRISFGDSTWTHISHQMLKTTSETICLPLSILFRYSLRACKFQSDWKLARVMPSFKKDDKSSPSNYRPISLLSCAGKVMERVVYKYICNYIIEHSLLYSYQCGFLPGHSVYQLLEIYHNIFKNIDSNILSSIIIFCDISKAFDRVWHKALIKKTCIPMVSLVIFYTG